MANISNWFVRLESQVQFKVRIFYILNNDTQYVVIFICSFEKVMNILLLKFEFYIYFFTCFNNNAQEILNVNTRYYFIIQIGLPYLVFPGDNFVYFILQIVAMLSTYFR